MAGNRNDVFRFEERRLFENFAPHFSKRQTVLSRIEVLQTSGRLNGLEDYAANAGLFDGPIDNRTYFVVINSTL